MQHIMFFHFQKIIHARVFQVEGLPSLTLDILYTEDTLYLMPTR